MSTISKEAHELADKAASGVITEWQLAQDIQSLLDAQKAESEKALDAEQGRWQEAIYTDCCALAPNKNIDGAGCDSGDPLDLTLAEIEQAGGALQDERDEALAAITELRAACAEKDEALKGVLGNEDRTIGMDYLIHVLHFEACETALSSHGESIMAELTRLKEELEHVKTMHELRGKAILLLTSDEEANALRARAESAEKESGVYSEIKTEVERATRKLPTWPTDPNHAFAVVGEEYGEALKEVLQLTYEPHKSSKESVRKESIQLAAMSIRFLMSLDRYEYVPREQHSQAIDAASPPQQGDKAP